MPKRKKKAKNIITKEQLLKMWKKMQREYYLEHPLPRGGAWEDKRKKRKKRIKEEEYE